MTIRTTIPYRNGQQFAPSIGPTSCDRCKRSLIDRSPDAKEDSVDHATNAELVLYVWESDVDDAGRALCAPCSEEDDQADAYMGIVKWKSRAENRGYYCDRNGVTVYEGQVKGPTFAQVGGKLDTVKVLNFCRRDPLLTERVTNQQIVARLERLADETEAAERRLGHTWNDADELQECPKTERNCER